MDRFSLEKIKVTRGGGTALEVDRLGIEAGRITALIGPNGSGKTTLLLLLAGLLAPDRGTVTCQGKEVTGGSDTVLEDHRRNNHLLLQDPYLFSRSVKWNVSYGLTLQGVKGPELEERAAAAITATGLLGMEERSARELSGGEAQRVALARALALEPEALLLDEPLANVDSASRAVMERVLLEENLQNNTTIVFTTHDMDQAHRLADNIVTLHDGRLAESSMENTFHGVVERIGNSWHYRTGNLTIALPGNAGAAKTAAIPPESIIVSLTGEMTTSARNSLTGTVTAIRDRNGSVDIEVNVGEPLVARITPTSYEKMGLKLGQEVWLLFKAEAVKLY
jgi:tungstate transport system ATP-binding protein